MCLLHRCQGGVNAQVQWYQALCVNCPIHKNVLRLYNALIHAKVTLVLLLLLLFCFVFVLFMYPLSCNFFIVMSKVSAT